MLTMGIRIPTEHLGPIQPPQTIRNRQDTLAAKPNRTLSDDESPARPFE
jgi:hypothetical protein